MGFKPITLRSKELTLHKAVKSPDFNSGTVLVENAWDYVEMWLKGSGLSDALSYWTQARNFYTATKQLPKEASPLTAYYCFLNATKALLKSKRLSFDELHGVEGKELGGTATLTNEGVTLHSKGVLSELCKYLNEPYGRHYKYNLYDLLYNLPYIHRSYCLTFGRPELYIPVERPIFVRRDDGVNKSWFCIELQKRYSNGHTLNKLPSIFERDTGRKVINRFGDIYLIRSRVRFDWRHGRENKEGNLERLTLNHRKIRNHLFYIYGPYKLWYLKRKGGVDGFVSRSTLTITYAAMHRLSELVRYKPLRFLKHFNNKHNWLLSEFINKSLYQFIDEVASEITGKNFMPPSIRS